MILEPYHSYLILAVVLIAIEFLLLQLMVGWVLLIGIASFITAFIALFHGLNYPEANLVLLVVSLLLVAICVKPLRKWQKSHRLISDGSDIIGQQCLVCETISVDKPGAVKFSGVKWRAALELSASTDAIKIVEKGKTVQISSVKGITLFVKI